MRRIGLRYEWIQVIVLGILWSTGAWTAEAQIGEFLKEVPKDKAPARKPPASLRPGTRLLYHGGQSVVHNVKSFLVPGHQANHWQWKDAENSGGVGYIALDVLQATPERTAADIRYYLLDTQTENATSSGASSVTGNGGSLDIFWVSPAQLAKTGDGREEGQQINRVRYSANGREYNALSILIETEKTYNSRIYDLDTGILLASSTSVQNDNVTILSGRKLANAAGARVIEHARFIERRELKIPWAAEPAPDWAVKGLQLIYEGNYGTRAAADLPPLTYGLNLAVRFEGGTRDCFVVTSTIRRDIGSGLPPQESTSRRCVGSARLCGLWVSPGVLRQLKPNQIIDEDRTMKFRTTFAGVQGNIAVFVEQGPVEMTQYGYDLENGMLTNVSTVSQTQVGQNMAQYQLVNKQ